MNETYIKFVTKLNSLLKDKSTEEITKFFPNIKSIILKELDRIATEYSLSNNDKKLFIEEKFNEFKIKGIPIKMYEKSWEEKSHFLQDYKKLYDVANKLDIFPKKTVKIIVNEKAIDIEVLDTGKKYIPSSDFDISLEIIQILDDLKYKAKLTKEEVKQDFVNAKNEIEGDFNNSINIINNAKISDKEEVKSL